MEFIVANTREQIEACKEALFAFRPNLEEDTYVDLILNMIKNEAFSLVYIPDASGKKAAAFTGFRIQHTLRTGWMIYVDDLYTDPNYRGKGYAGALLDYIDEVAEAQQIQSVNLDSGYALFDAHRLYLKKGYILACHHFAKLSPGLMQVMLASAN